MGTDRCRAGAVAIAVAATLGTAAACGGGGVKAGPSGAATPAGEQSISASSMSFLVKAEKTIAQARSARVESTATVGSALSVRLTGTIDWSAGLRGDMKTASKARNPAAAITEYRFTHDALYARFDDAYAVKLGGKHWITYAYADLAERSAAQAATVNGPQNANPVQSVGLLIAGGEVKEVGKESVRGVAATHYAGTVDVSRLSDRGARPYYGLTAARLRQLKAALSQQGITSDHIDVWVDSAGLPVKKTERVDMATGPVVSSAYYSDFGAAAGVVAPPASDTLDYAALLKKASAGRTP